MNGVISFFSGNIYFTQYATGSLILTLFTFTLALFFLSGRRKTSSTINLGLCCICLSLFHFSFFISLVVYHPAAAYHRWFAIAGIIFAPIFITRTILFYPDNQNRKTANIASIILFSIAVIFILIYIKQTIGALKVFSFDAHFWDLKADSANRQISIVILLEQFVMFGFAIWRSVSLYKKEFFWFILVITIMVIGTTTPAVLNVLNRDGLISRELFLIGLNLSHMFAFFLVAIFYLNTTRDRFSFLGKIVGVSVVTFLAVFIIVNHFAMKRIESGFDARKSDDIIKGLCRRDFPPEITYAYMHDIVNRKTGLLYSMRVTGELPEGCMYEYFNTAFIEEIKLLQDFRIESGLPFLLSESDRYFDGYAGFIKNIVNSETDRKKITGEFIYNRLIQIQPYIAYTQQYISTMDDRNFRTDLKRWLITTTDFFRPFSDAIEAHVDSSRLEGEALKNSILCYIRGMKPSGSRIYRENTSGEKFIAYLIYDSAERKIYEAGFPYIKYREYMHPTAVNITLFIIGVMLFMIICYPLFFYGTLYRPLNSLLDGVKKVMDGDLSFRATVHSEDEIGFLTDKFNLMVKNLENSRKTILDSEKKFRELSNLLPDIIYETDTNLRITYLNIAGRKLAGNRNPEDGDGIQLADLVSEEDLNAIRDFLAIGSNYDVFSRTHNVMSADGSSIIGENRAVIVFDGNKPAGLRGSIRDITEKRKTEEALLQVQKMETIGTLASGLAHDFNNILAGIIGPLSLIKYSSDYENSMNTVEFREYLDIMEKSGTRAMDLVRQLMTLAKSESIRMVPVDLLASVNHVIKICRSAFDKSIDIKTSLPEKPSLTKGDPTQIEQSILNLCVNASHAMTIMRKESEKNGGELSVSLEIVQADEHFRISHPEAFNSRYWVLSVKDTGVGMDSSTISKIFIPFFTTKDKHTGTGLGLSMVYSIIHNHEGFIDIYSEPGTGSVFNIYLPVLESEIPGESIELPEIPRGSGTILIADDEELVRLTARSMLEKCGYIVITVNDGEECIKTFLEMRESIDLVLVDLVMPRMSGDMATAELRRISPDVKILLASGLTYDDRVEKTLNIDGIGVIQKPYTIDRLASAVYDLLRADPAGIKT